MKTMKPTLVRAILLGTVAVLGTATLAQAGSLGGFAGCLGGSFGSYSAQNFRCNLGAVDVFNFELYTVDAGGIPTVADSTLLSLIRINPVWNATTGTAFLTIAGFTDLIVDEDTTRAWLIRFTVDPPPVVGGETMELDPPFGNILGTQSYCEDGLFSQSGGCSSGLSGTTTFGIGSPASLTFEHPLATLDTLTTIRLNPNAGRGGGVASGFDGIIFSIQTVPEPGAWLLAASGLALLGLRRRTRAPR